MDSLDAPFASVTLAPKPNILDINKEEKQRKDREKERAEREKEKEKESEEKEREDDPLRSKRFTNATSISSDQLFQRNEFADTTPDQRARLNQYADAHSISSDQLFDRDKTEADTSIDFADLKHSVVQKTKKLSSMASGLISSIKSRYG